MNRDIYKTYRFDFDMNVYLREFKKALESSGITKPAMFQRMLNDAGVKKYDYETVKSYYYGRRVPPLNVFIAVCKSLNLSADKIAFPESIKDPEYNRELPACEYLFRNIFYPYNYSEENNAFVDLDEMFFPETYESNVDELALILSKYNYLIQKYHYASVSNDELDQIYAFTQIYIIERNKNTPTEAEDIMEWMRSHKDGEFLEEFYNRYTIGFYGMSCSSLLHTLSKAIDSKYIRYASQLLPIQDTSLCEVEL